MLYTRVCDILGIDLPILSAPMAGSAAADLVAAVSGAGGFGLIGGTTPGGADWLRAQIRAVRERTDRPFGVGFITSAPRVERLMQVAIEERVAAIAHSFADPSPHIGACHAAGIKVIAQVQTVAGAVQAARAGADLIAAQGTEAGGHTGHVGALPLIPAVIDAVGGVPVIAAGGIADGRGLAAVLMLGAEGAWLGTRFVASREWAGPAWAKERVIAAGADETILTKAFDLAQSAPFPREIGDRVLQNAFTAEWHARDAEVEQNKETLAARLAAAVEAGDTTLAPIRAGTGSGLIHEILPAAEIVRQIVAEAVRMLRERPGQVIREFDPARLRNQE